ncbi:hypothetical protein [Rhodoplanes roseus]|uniref:Flagellar assembly protein T N-terminal domain-containing protein n=1 Tax=Rhodoplanes roseus TaxID=29409 RepID=A0A327L0P5_9BRAD|nr:hypothetical protein [Rhodoplanes roseus]RAI43082.1 hypothetical protein CH341_16140 [Rhodoplanes roseus]
MRALAVVASLTLALSGPAWSQAKGGAKPAPTPPGETVRYMTIFGELMGALPSDAIWRETRQGNRVVSAVLDLCHSVTPASNRKDRFVVTLKPEGGKLVGTGQSEPDGVPITVSLTRKQSGDTYSLDGTITRDGKPQQVGATDLSDMSEAEFKDQQSSEDEIITTPASFSEVSPVSVAVRVSRDGFADLVKSLRGQGVRVDYASLVQSCADLRSGQQMVRIETAPDRSAALVAKLAAMPGVTAAGWTTGSYGIERAVRVGAAAWTDGGALKADALAQRLGAAVGTALHAKPVSAQWDDVTRELTLKLERPDQAARGLDLTEAIEITLLVGPEKPGPSENLVIWIGDSSVEATDKTAGAQLAFTSGYQGNDEESAAIETDALMAALARDLQGQIWNAETSGWK